MMTDAKVKVLASELVQEWISTGPDADYVHDYFDGQIDQLSASRIHSEACRIAKEVSRSAIDTERAAPAATS